MPLSNEDQKIINDLTNRPGSAGFSFNVTTAVPFTADQPAGDAAVSYIRITNANDTGRIVKASAGNLYGYGLTNLTAGTIFVKFYNKATAPTAADTPVLIVMVPASQSVLVTPNNGIIRSFSAGISVRAVTGAADADTTSPATAPIIEVYYK